MMPFAGDTSPRMGTLVNDQLRSMIRREFMLLALGMVIFVTGLALLWADLI